MPFNLPRITKALLIANIAVFALQWLMGDGARVFDGIMPLGTGARRTWVNYRFAQPDRASAPTSGARRSSASAAPSAIS